MKNIIKTLIIVFIVSSISAPIYSQRLPEGSSSGEKIHWHTFDEAVKLNKKHPKKLFMDVYTDWCGWCKRYDAVTFSNPVIVKYVNDNFYAVKFNAERKDTIVFKGKTYVNPNPNNSKSVHELAAYFLKGRMSYPTVVFLTEDLDLLTVIPGYNEPQPFEKIINFLGSNAFRTQKFEDYKETFKGTIQN